MAEEKTTYTPILIVQNERLGWRDNDEIKKWTIVASYEAIVLWDGYGRTRALPKGTRPGVSEIKNSVSRTRVDMGEYTLVRNYALPCQDALERIPFRVTMKCCISDASKLVAAQPDDIGNEIDALLEPALRSICRTYSIQQYNQALDEINARLKGSLSHDYCYSGGTAR
jgi:hypothetical protein